MAKWQRFFQIAAFWNLLASIIALSNLRYNATHFFKFTEQEWCPSLAILLSSFWVAVLLFGVGYYQVSRDPQRERTIIGLAIVGKLYVGIVWGYGAMAGYIGLIAGIGGLCDIIFALIFINFLRRRF